jgi:hypothetical protein
MLLFIFLSTTYIIKFSIYFCFQFFFPFRAKYETIMNTTNAELTNNDNFRWIGNGC